MSEIKKAFRDFVSLKALRKCFLKNSYVKERENAINQDQAKA
jgi:hypothetical protein